MAGRSGEKVKLTSYDDLFQVDNIEGITEIVLSELKDYKNHPFKVLDNEQMDELVESIRVNGVLNPIMVRKSKSGYEIISGHRRKHAAEILKLEKIPAIVKELTDDESTVLMVDSNIQREEILPSERAFALKMKMEALSHQGTSRRDVEKLTCEELGESSGMSGRQVQRYIRLTELIPELLEYVDEKRLQVMLAVDVSYLCEEIQERIKEYIRYGGKLRPDQISSLKQLQEQNLYNQDTIRQVLYETAERQKTKNVTLSENHLSDYFPPEYTKKDMEQVIYRLLEQWKAEMEGDEENGSR